eukprot:PhF_6_TR29321/c0_g1_i1/m.43024
MRVSLRGRNLESFDVRNQRVFADDEIKDKLAVVKILDLAQNQITHVSGFQPFTSLTVLDLSNNRLQTLRGLPITLTKLLVAHNNLASLEGLAPLVTLQTLDVSHNALYSLEGLPRTSALTDLNVSHNRLATLHGIENSVGLRVFNAQHNYVQNIEHLQPLESTPLLRSILLSHNPVSSLPSYFNVLSRLLPELDLVDGVPLPKSALVGDRRSGSAKRKVHVSFSDDTGSLHSRSMHDIPSNIPPTRKTSTERGRPESRTTQPQSARPASPNVSYVDPSVTMGTTGSSVGNIPPVNRTPLPVPLSTDAYSVRHKYATVEKQPDVSPEMRLLQVRNQELERLLQQKTEKVSTLERDNRRMESELSNTRKLLAEQMERFNKMRSEHQTLTSMVTHLRMVADKNAKEFKHAHTALNRARSERLDVSAASVLPTTPKPTSTATFETRRTTTTNIPTTARSEQRKSPPKRSNSARPTPSSSSTVLAKKPPRSHTPPPQPISHLNTSNREYRSNNPLSTSRDTSHSVSMDYATLAKRAQMYPSNIMPTLDARPRLGPGGGVVYHVSPPRPMH